MAILIEEAKPVSKKLKVLLYGPSGSVTFVVLIPCKSQLGYNLMAAYDMQAIWENNFHTSYEA